MEEDCCSGDVEEGEQMDDSLLTDEQRESIRRLRRYIEREDLRPIMNTTKWREAIATLKSLQPAFPVRFRAKVVSSAEMPTWDSSFPWHLPQPFFGVEWLDIQTVVTFPGARNGEGTTHDRTDAILHELRSHHVPFSYADGVVLGISPPRIGTSVR
jgi:hypothetical protein